MKKKNNGFILLETLVVASFIISTLVFLYVQFANLKKNFDTSFKYDTVPGLYGAKTVNNFILKKYGYGSMFGDSDKSKNSFIELYNLNDKCNDEYFSDNKSLCNSLMEKLKVKTVLLVSNNIDNFNEYLKSNNKYSQNLYLYSKKLKAKDSEIYTLMLEYSDNTIAGLVVYKKINNVDLYYDGKQVDSKILSFSNDVSFNLSDSQISNSTNIMCNNDAIPSISENTLNISGAITDTNCYLSKSLSNSVKLADNTANNVLMIKNETFNNQLVIPATKNLVLNLNQKSLTYNASDDEAMVYNKGKLIINDESGNGSMNTNFRLLKNEGLLTINNGKYNRTNSDSTAGGVVHTSLNGNTILNGGTFTTDTTWSVFSLDSGNTTINGGKIVSSTNSSVHMANNGTCTINNGVIQSTSGSGLGLQNSGECIINGGEFISSSGAAINSYNESKITVNNAKAHSTSSYAVKNSNTAVATLNDGEFYSSTGGAVINYDQGITNINGGKIYTSGAASTISNNGSKTININSKKRIYVGNFNTSSQWGATAVKNVSSGTINIKGSKSDVCNETAGVNTKGICVYSNYRAVLNESGSTGTINIDGMTSVSETMYAVNLYSGLLNASNSNFIGGSYAVAIIGGYSGTYGTINLCTNTINGTTNDIFANNGLVKYKSDNSLTHSSINGTTNVKLDNTITCK